MNERSEFIMCNECVPARTLCHIGAAVAVTA